MIKNVKNNLFLGTFLFILHNHQCWSNVTRIEDNPRDILFRELSPDAYFNLPSHEPGDTSPTSRRQLKPREHYLASNWLNSDDYTNMTQHNQLALKYGPEGTVVDTSYYPTGQENKNRNTLNPDAITIFHLCYAISYMWRRGRKGIHRYYNLRDTYYDHLPFEIGYMTQAIMAKYQNVLELYEYATKMEKDKKIGRPHLYFFYKNILEECRNIIHLCNMMHEVTRKYRVLQYSAYDKEWIPVNYDPSQKFQDPAGNVYRYADSLTNDHRPLRQKERGIQGFEHEKRFHDNPDKVAKIKMAQGQEVKEKMRQELIQKRQKKNFGDQTQLAITSSSGRPSRSWQAKQPLEYGWDSNAQFD